MYNLLISNYDVNINYCNELVILSSFKRCVTVLHSQCYYHKKVTQPDV